MRVEEKAREKKKRKRKIQFKEVVASQKRNKVARRFTERHFSFPFWSRTRVDEMQPPRCFVLLAVKRQRWHRETENRKCESGNLHTLSAQGEKTAASRMWRDLPRALVCTPVSSLDVARVLKAKSMGPEYSDGVGGGLNCHKAALLTR